ncbi:UNVERIFIED_CONTAM: exocyst complex component exo84 [Siphonaria sp. JEL0065]|nr:exocyst complex component exo84 [Siphonaria sp. JEL0065]
MTTARNITLSTVSTAESAIHGIDLAAYGEVDFKAESYLNGILAKLPEDGVRSYRATLKDAKDAAAKDLQRNVHRNYSEFVLISKEISSLEGDVLLLRGLLNDLSTVNSGYKIGQILPSDENLKEQEDTETASPSKKTIVNPLTSTELQEQQRIAMENLYETIDGLKKVLPISKARHIIRDGTDTRISEINPSNYKQKQQVFMHVLNDTLLVVIKKKNILNGKTKTVIEKCFRLIEMAIIDMKDSSDITNAFKIMSHPDVYMYRTETWEEKRSLLAVIKRVSDEIIGQKKKDRDAAQKAAIKIAAPEMDTPKPAIDTAVSKVDAAASPKHEDISAADAKWLSELSYDLDVLIAHREFDTAAKEILKARNTFTTHPDAKIKYQYERQDVEDRVDILASFICRDLANPIASKTQIQDNIDRLILLGLGSQARAIFLEARTAIIHHRIKLVKFDGDVADYVNDLSMVVFRLIRSTCDWYNISFKESTMASGFLKWVRNEIESFGDIVRRQVFESHKPFCVIAECLDHTLHHCEMLREIGLDLTFVLNQLFHHDLINSIEEYRRKGKEQIISYIDEDSFQLVECAENDLIKSGDLLAPGLDSGVAISVSVLQMYDFLMDFGADMGLIMSIQLYAKIVWCLTDFFSTYLIRIMDVFEKKWTNKQYYAMISNCGYVIDQMMPQVSNQLAIRFDRSIPELDEHRGRLRGVISAMQNNFVKLKVKHIVQNVFSLQAVDYSSTASILENAKPTENAITFLSEINDLLRDAENSSPFRKISTDIIQGVFSQMMEATSWETDRGPLRFGFCGVQQLVLDIHFFLHVAEPFVNPQANEMANKVCEKALRAYFTQNAKIRANLKTGEWYDRRVQEETRLWNFPFLTMNELAGANQF